MIIWRNILFDYWNFVLVFFLIGIFDFSKFMIFVCLERLIFIKVWFEVVVRVVIRFVLLIFGFFFIRIGLFSCRVCSICYVLCFVVGVFNVKLMFGDL